MDWIDATLFEGLFWLLCIICYWTGEVLLFSLTLGYRKPRWDWSSTTPPTDLYFESLLSGFLGFFFWLGLGAGAYALLAAAAS